MRSREEFGRYLLLKKLTEDPLGETFRAGVSGAEGLEQVVLLRVFNGRSLDAETLWGRVSGREAVQKALKSPNIGSGVDLGEVRGVPFAAYEYISGKNLESLLIQASNTNSPIPADHALLIAERVALALAAAAETRAGDERIVHGFAVPHLVMISNEGETRLLGFEMAPGLVEQAGGFGREITRYLAPELVAGGKAERSDDVFTLGAVLFELLACKPLPEAGADGYAPVVAAAQVAYDGTPLPPALASLLTKSLAPRGERLPDAAAWHKALTQRMAEAGHAATIFNLAFFMHNLFRDEIEAESREIERERAMPAPAAAGAAGAAATAAAGRKQPSAAAAASAAAPPPAAAGAAAERKGPSKAVIATLAAALVLVLAAAGWWALQGGLGAEKAEAEPVAQALPDPVPAEPEGPTPEEIQTQLAAMIDSRSEEMAEQLRDQYDQRIRDLQKQLEQAEAEAARREQERIAARERAEEAAAAAAQAEPERQPDEGQPATTAGNDDAEAARAGEGPTAAAGTPATTGPAGTGGAASQVEAAATKPAADPPKPAPAEAKKAEPPKPQPAAPKTRRGDLVNLGEGVKPPQLVEEPRASYPGMAKKLSKEADVDVRVLVDETGRVREAELLAKKRAGFGFDDAALDAARSARYKPAEKDGVEVKMHVNLTIRFRL